MPLLQFPQWAPDIADYQGGSSQTVTNVVPRGDGYGPFPDFSAYSAAQAAANRGGIVALKTDGSVAIFGATSTKIYLLDNTALTWTDVSKGSGTYSAVSSTDNWQFRQYGNYILAVQANTTPQYYDLTSSTNFADLSSLGDAPPTARYIDIVGRFVVLSGLVSNPYRIQWSGLGNVTQWTSGVNSSDFQDLPDGGTVRGVAGGESGTIFQDRSIRRMTYAPGSPVIFQIERVAEDNGLYSAYSTIRAGEKIFYLSPKGFFKIDPGSYPAPIGKERVDRTFFADVDTANLQLLIGAADPRNSRVFWAYKSNNGASGLFDKILCYDYGLDRWTKISVSGEYLLSLSQPGVTLEGLDIISSSIDAGVLAPFDSYPGSSLPEIAGFNSAHKFSFFRGSNLEATIDSQEQGTAGTRIYVNGFRPITDAATVYGSASTRESTQASGSYSSEQLINTQGRIPLRVSTRYSRLRSRIPAGTSWTYAAGVEPDIRPEGQR